MIKSLLEIVDTDLKRLLDKIKNKQFRFIGAGDNIFHSHFITGAGLNRIFDFTVKCVNQLDQILY